jgi:hypothetical protein
MKPKNEASHTASNAVRSDPPECWTSAITQIAASARVRLIQVQQLITGRLNELTFRFLCVG